MAKTLYTKEEAEQVAAHSKAKLAELVVVKKVKGRLYWLHARCVEHLEECLKNGNYTKDERF